MDSLYKPQGVEERWQRTWEAEGLYNADPDPSRESFAIAHPPPNVTGDLHLGHALQLSLADTIVRTRRMQGYNVLFQPGFDHAGIATQMVSRSTSRRRGRRGMTSAARRSRRSSGTGCASTAARSCSSSGDRRVARLPARALHDGRRLRARGHALLRPPLRKGWIYRANRIINWCPYHLTRSRISRSRTSTSTTRSRTSAIRSPTATGT